MGESKKIMCTFGGTSDKKKFEIRYKNDLMAGIAKAFQNSNDFASVVQSKVDVMSLTCEIEHALDDNVQERIFHSERSKEYSFSMMVEDKKDYTKKPYNFNSYIVSDITRKGEIRINVFIESKSASKHNSDYKNIFPKMGYQDCMQISKEVTKNISDYLEKNNGVHMDDYLLRDCLYSIDSENYIDKKNKIFKFFARDDYNLLLPSASRFIDYVENLVKCRQNIFTFEEDYLNWKKALTDASFDKKIHDRILLTLIEFIFYCNGNKSDEKLINLQLDDKSVDKYRVRNMNDYKKYLEKELWK